MKNKGLKMKYLSMIVVFTLALVACSNSSNVNKIESPDKQVSLSFEVNSEGLNYLINYQGEILLSKSALGLILRDSDTLFKNMKVLKVVKASIDTTWEQPWGEKRYIKNSYNQMIVYLQEKEGKNRKLNLIFKVYNDGLGFRYEIPKQDEIDSIVIMDEITEFSFTDNHMAWWIPAYGDNRYEYIYSKNSLNELDTVHTPLTIETTNGKYLAIHEANLTNYASMTLVSEGNNTLKCDLVPWSDGTKVKTTSPMVTPWRTIQIGDVPGDLVESSLILNLNEPNKLDDVSWVKPMKYMGIWWGMHINKYSFFEGPKHGASTKNSKYYIDFAADNDIQYLLIEGWNKGWTSEWFLNKLHVFSFTQSTDDFDFNEVNDYAKSKGVSIVGYHETGSNLNSYLAQIDSGMSMYRDAGIHNIKIGQVGSRLQMKEWHQGQYGVEYYRYVLEKAADYKLTVNFHEPIKPTGLRRTMPNLMTGEGARGQEYNAWSEGNPPSHTCILPFTRLLGGPMDFTPGIFKIKPTRLHSTLSKQLALYLVIYSPIQMLADLPENYKDHPALKFLQDVPVDWEDTKVIDSKIGEYVTIARKDKYCNDWYLGSITNEEQREFNINLDFLEPNKKYIAWIYKDADNSDYQKNPEAYKIENRDVDNKTVLELKLARSGGTAIRFEEIKD